jgi:hypothetical protein
MIEGLKAIHKDELFKQENQRAGEARLKEEEIRNLKASSQAEKDMSLSSMQAKEQVIQQLNNALRD